MLNPPMDIESMIRNDIARLEARVADPKIASVPDFLRPARAQLTDSRTALASYLEKKARR
jgi:hypothetical protein